MRAVFKFVFAVVKLAIYVAIFAGLAYAAVFYRDAIVVEAERLGVPESVAGPVREKLDEGAHLIVAYAEKAPFKWPVPLPSSAATPVPHKPGDQKTEAPKPAVPGQATAPAPTPAPTRPTQAAISILVAEVRVQPVPVVLDLLGTAQAVASIPVKSRIDSQIETVAVKEGDAVKAGQLIFTLDARSIRAQIKQTEALITRDEAVVAQTEAALDRATPLSSQDFMSKKDLDTAKANAGTARATLGADRAALENLKVLESYYEIRSPVDGRIGSLPLKPGSSVRAADATLLATINQTTPIYVNFAVPQTNVAVLREALARGPLPVSVAIPGSSAGRLSGVVAFTENAIDLGSGSLLTKSLVQNAEERLIPGQFVEVRVTLRVEDKAVVVPEAAVQIGQQGTYAFVLKPDNTVELRPVTQDRKVDGQVVIARGLTAGEKVVVDGGARLFPNARVEIRQPPKPAQPDATPKPAPTEATPKSVSSETPSKSAQPDTGLAQPLKQQTGS